MILLLATKFGLVRQAYGLFQHIRFDFKFFGHGLDGITQPTIQRFYFVHDLHTFVDDLRELGFLFSCKRFILQNGLRIKSLFYTRFCDCQ
jgi:hypothetical protein